MAKDEVLRFRKKKRPSKIEIIILSIANEASLYTDVEGFSHPDKEYQSTCKDGVSFGDHLNISYTCIRKETHMLQMGIVAGDIFFLPKPKNNLSLFLHKFIKSIALHHWNLILVNLC